MVRQHQEMNVFGHEYPGRQLKVEAKDSPANGVGQHVPPNVIDQ
jgi:hypothetical protein